mgnify:CR=1 FL=1
MATRTPLSWIAIIDLALRWHVCISLSVYGGAKWVQFAYGADIDTPAKDLSDMELMWAFYGRSQEYASIIGVLEIAAGILLLFQRTKLLGVLLGTTILVNVILQDVFYNVLSGALLAALFYQVELLAIAWMDRQRIRSALRELARRATPVGNGWTWWQAALALGAVVLLFFLEKWLVPALLW